MSFSYDGSFYSTVSTVSTTSSYIHEQPRDLLFDFEVPYWDQFNFEPLVPYAVGDDNMFAPFLPLQPPAETYSPLLPPLESSESSTTPSLSAISTPNLPLAGSPPAQPPVTQPITPPTPPTTSQPTTPPTPSATTQPTITQPTTLPTPPTPPWQPSSKQIPKFDFCPFTRLGQVCGHISWACSANKQIKRHLKMDHFPDTALGYECPNPECTNKDYRFLRKDACDEHRKGCNLQQAPGYVPMANIVTGSDVEVDCWMRARLRQRKAIVAKLRSGTPWSQDLLEPVNL